ncbi:asparagine synthase (glutamine-hydrolyzing) [Lysinibacillus pakistanensis]|uniref:asparagine synthase (glutamine-hydrolyzing) n=1 Tax=Lysinibacillus pakistanensis TaxID=759811 RepID=A0AAX3WWQ3_9BACI|nr:asparagine synthase (glutamine-hydrolyzing) [Lysinibacillus pakistanensis]MDM5231133.1 asparagine synthase (glutamine-hydrolyzing) [Lysinibacillus pakistanensis]WHY46691.1 asparagine synthase (glutamine-hydrolyzing) [Lysinibacillus pakistanensis]WHY51704.1 asparagine synthase (glutamine-hydrolyzing) [Lysinibacillus pakistanensis]
MCGITGWASFQKDLRTSEEIIKLMTQTLEKRGPDDENIWCNEHIAFGHRRLAVIDLIGGKQPMTKIHEGSNYVITYNGELYNTEELRKELQNRGYTFTTHSDTEVLLTAYIEWKEQCVDFFNGIFAFGVWDEQSQSLFLCRDRLGVKPLYYTEQHDGLLFASEVKALLAHPMIKAAVNTEGLANIIAVGPSRTPGKALFQNINELRPGYAMRFSREGIRIWQYWRLQSEYHDESLEDTVDHVRFLLTDAIERQLVSDVPICTFLSGGLDSSIITGIASNRFQLQGKDKLHTYSIDYEDNERFFNPHTFQTSTDTYWIEQMTNTFKTDHHAEEISQQQLIDLLMESVIVRDSPGMADVDSSLLWFCREIKKDFTVALSGECADEIFGGYPWFTETTTGFPWIRSLAERTTMLQDRWRKKLAVESYVQHVHTQTINEVPYLQGESVDMARHREMFYLNMVWFMQTLLERKDRMSMGASLEVRVPFADHRLVEYTWNIPWEMKNLGGMEKGLLRKAMDQLLPKEVLYRKKNPYPKTYHPVYTTGVQKWLGEIMKDKNSILHELFERQKLIELIESGGSSFKVPWYGQLMAGPQLLAYLGQIHTWFEHYNIQLIES